MKSFFLFLSAFAIGYAVWQSIVLSKSLRALRTQELEKRELAFHQRQHRRRIQISVLIGICGLCIFAGIHFSHETQKVFFLLAWALAVLFISWTVLLALVDALSIRMHFRRHQNRNLAEEMKYRYQLEQAMKERETMETED